MLKQNQLGLSWEEGAQQIQMEFSLWNCEGWRDKEVEGNIPLRQN